MNFQDLFKTLSDTAKCEHYWEFYNGTMKCKKCGFIIPKDK